MAEEATETGDTVVEEEVKDEKVEEEMEEEAEEAVPGIITSSIHSDGPVIRELLRKSAPLDSNNKPRHPAY